MTAFFFFSPPQETQSLQYKSLSWMPEYQPDHCIRTTQEINSGNIEAIILSPTFADKVAAKRAKKKKCRIKEREIKKKKVCTVLFWDSI